MRQVFLASLGSLVAGAGLVLAQAAPGALPSEPPLAGAVAKPPPVPWASSAPLIVLDDGTAPHPGGGACCPVSSLPDSKEGYSICVDISPNEEVINEWRNDMLPISSRIEILLEACSSLAGAVK